MNDEGARLTALDIALAYIRRGWVPVPVPFREKAPAGLDKWQRLRISAETARQYFNGGPQNIGILLGAPSGNLVDVDLDTPEARAVAPFFLPTTRAIFGRKTSRSAHHLYIADKAPGTKAYNDPLAKEGDTKARIVELRGTGGQTIFPGSTHRDTGEPIEWEHAGDPAPATVSYGALLQAVERVATFALIATHWDTGTRDDLCTATVGVLLRAGFTDDEIRNALRAIAAAAADEKIETRMEKIGRLRETREAGGAVFGFPKLAELTDAKVANAVRRWLRAGEDEPEALAGPEAAVGTAEELTGVPYEVPVIVPRYLIEDAGGLVGPGGGGKTTLSLYESVRIALGLPLYGREIARPGATLILTAEDRRAVVFSRLNKICRAMNLTAEQYERVRASIFVEDICSAFAKLAAPDAEGNVRPTTLPQEIITKYRGCGLAQVIFDPTSLIGPGERFGNDGFAELLRVARFLSEQLRCAVRLVHHVSQAVFREGIQDQYAARGGTAFVDGSRFQHQLLTVRGREFECEMGTYAIPAAAASDDDIAQGRVLAILVHKLSYDERDRTPIFLLRRAFEFTHVESQMAAALTPAQHSAADLESAERVRELLVRKLAEGVRLSGKELDDYCGELGMKRAAVRRALSAARGARLVSDAPLPEGERRGARKTYLHPAEEGAF